NWPGAAGSEDGGRCRIHADGTGEEGWDDAVGDCAVGRRGVCGAFVDDAGTDCGGVWGRAQPACGEEAELRARGGAGVKSPSHRQKQTMEPDGHAVGLQPGAYIGWIPKVDTGRRETVFGVPNSSGPTRPNLPFCQRYRVRMNPEEQQSPSCFSRSNNSTTNL